MSSAETHNLSNGYKANGANGSNGVNTTNAFRGEDHWVPISENPVFTPRKIRMICIGAGYSGMILAHKIKYELKLEHLIDLVIYEKNHDIGGTWLENRYPGVACDIPAHVYTFPFEPNPDWSRFYAGGSEIWEYMKRTVTKWNLDEKVRLRSKVREVIWNEDSAKWKVKVDTETGLIEDEAEILVNGSGILNKWTWPKIPGLSDFKGKMLHSANWDSTYETAGKRIAVIGNGSSAIQIVPVLQKTASRLVNYFRDPTWISVNFCENLTPDGTNFDYTPEQRKDFLENPKEFLEMRKSIEGSINSFFFSMFKDSPQQQYLHDTSMERMLKSLNNDPELAAKFIPDWKIGCRRLTPGDGYLSALQQSNAGYCSSPIHKITEKGILTGDGEEEFDLIITATGFDVSFVPSFKAVGRDGHSLDDDEWKVDPQAYFSVCAPHMPNYFIFNGPNCPIAHGSLLTIMARTADYVLQWAQKMAQEDIRSVVPKPSAVYDYNVYTQEFLKRMVWTSGCRSWYKNGKTEGKPTAMFAGSGLHYAACLDKIRGEDFEIDYNSKNSFRWMGNGLTARELKKGEDLAWYMTV